MTETLLLKSHAAAGFLALFFGIINLINQKGGRMHRRLGMAYFFCMFYVFVSALVILIFYRFFFFLMAIAVFSFYLCFSGYRVLKRKKPGQETWLDQSAAYFTLAFGVVLFITGIYFMLKSKIFLGMLSLIFGAATFNAGWTDVKIFRKKKFEEKKWWWYHHIQAMVGSMIAATTAFLVQNGMTYFPTFKHQWIFWLLPGVIGTPLIIMWVNKYREKFKGKA